MNQMPKTLRENPFQTVAVIGGGLSGAAVAHAILRLDPALRCVVIEPRAVLGQGLAYSTPDVAHRLNVPSVRMSLMTDQPEDFDQWLKGPTAQDLPPDSVTAEGLVFAPRALFGRYVAERLAPWQAEGRLSHLRAEATAVEEKDGGFAVSVAGLSTPVRAGAVVLAVAHPAPAIPPALAGLAGTDRLIADPFARSALEGIAPGERLLVVGSGLTSADILATLRDREPGRIDVLSRHGLRSRPHGPAQAETAADFASAPSTTALALLRRIRRALAQDAGRGLTWHATFDRLRKQGPEIWAALPDPERLRLLRHLRGLWDVHRFRIAPQSLAAVEVLEDRGIAHFHRGKLLRATASDGGVFVSWRPRGTQAVHDLSVDRVLLATGPDHGRVTQTNPLLADLRARGLVQPDPYRLGLWVTREGAAIGADGTARSGLFVAGPLARGTVGELMGVPEVTAWAEHIARQSIAALGAKVGA